MVTVNSWEDLLNFGTDIVLDKIHAGDIELKDDLVFQIRIKGPTWNNYIDYRGASYILELQRAVNRLYREVTESDIPIQSLQKQIAVKVRVVEGSSLFEIKLNDVLKRMFQKMTGRQITLVAVVTVLCATGYFTTGKILTYKQNIAQKQLSAEMTQRLTSSLDRAIEIIGTADLEKPSRTLINRLDKDDRITMPDRQELSSDQAKQRYPRKQLAKPKSGVFDGTYTIKSIDFDKIPPVFTVEKDGISFRALAELPPTDIDKLSTNLNETLKAGKDFIVQLQVFITYTKQGPKSASITGLGKKRPDTQPITIITEST